MTATDRIRDLLKRTPLVAVVQRLREWCKAVAWKRGRGPAPHSAKVSAVREYADRHGLRVFVETGTYLGEMVEAQSGHFDQVLSVELDDALHAAAVEKFAHHDNVRLFHGDSSVLLSSMINGIYEPALFWLDAHYSGGITARGELDTPISAELEVVLARKMPDVILVDDARCFDGTDDYPTVAAFRNAVVARRPDMQVEVAQDIIRVTPR